MKMLPWQKTKKLENAIELQNRTMGWYPTKTGPLSGSRKQKAPIDRSTGISPSKGASQQPGIRKADMRYCTKTYSLCRQIQLGFMERNTQKKSRNSK